MTQPIAAADQDKVLQSNLCEAGPDADADVEKAATVIQARFRGKQVRNQNAGSQAITVGLRMRPFVPADDIAHKTVDPKWKRGFAKASRDACLSVKSSLVSVVEDVMEDAKSKREGPWKVDIAMDSSDPSSPDFVDNEKCYQLMGRRMINDILKGFNTCLFCYGQTGTGKTTTIMGDEHAGPGVLRRLLDDIFEEAEKLRADGATVEIEIQMLEVYNEELRDLLLEKGKKAEHIKARTLPSGVIVQGAVTKTVQSADECQQLIEFGNSNKTMAATAMNPQSSRGHTVFKLVLKKSGGSNDSKFSSEVYFADLAGHEDIKTTQVTGDRLKELSFINGSLMWLQNALHSLAMMSQTSRAAVKVDFAKFRNSKLTLLLSNALTGNSRTAVIVTLSPSIVHWDTSLGSIKFAMEVKGIKIKATSSAGSDPAAIIKRLEEEIATLKARLADASQLKDAGGGTPRPHAEALHTEKLELQAELTAIRAAGAKREEEQRSEMLELQAQLATERAAGASAASASADAGLQKQVLELQSQLAAAKWQVAAAKGAGASEQFKLQQEVQDLHVQLVFAGAKEAQRLQAEVHDLRAQLASSAKQLATSASSAKGAFAQVQELREKLSDSARQLAASAAAARGANAEVHELRAELSASAERLAPSAAPVKGAGPSFAPSREAQELRQEVRELQARLAVQQARQPTGNASGCFPDSGLKTGSGRSLIAPDVMDQMRRALELSKSNVEQLNRWMMPKS